MTEKEKWPPTQYEWDKEDERIAVERDLYTKDIIPSRKQFDEIMGKMEEGAHDDVRYVVFMNPCIYTFDPKNDSGAAGPIEAIQACIEGHLDGGWNWYVWDRKQKVGFEIESNSFIYAPIDAWAKRQFGPASFQEQSSQYLREVIDAATSVLKGRTEL